MAASPIRLPSSSIGKGQWAWRTLLRLGFLAGLGLLGGAVAGFLAAGVGGRLAMRLVSLLAGHEHYGEITDAEQVVGRITVEGTIGFIAFFTFATGIIGGTLYVMARRWMPGTGIRKGLAYGGLLMLLFGSTIIEGRNSDFRRFVPSYLSVGLFASLFLLYGMIASAVVERLDRGGGARPRSRLLFLGGYLLLAIAAGFGLVRDIEALAAIF
jgi:hypothetical protein